MRTDRKKRPVIGIPAALSTPSETGYQYQQVGVPYVRALECCGALAILLPVTQNQDLVAEMLERVDGVLFQGGADIAPQLYGQERLPVVMKVNEATDEFELDVCRRAIERDLPVLAICRGIQVLNVALGGTLIQDLPLAGKMDVPHRQTQPRCTPTHPIKVTPGTRLAQILKTETLEVNTFHHQAIDQVGTDLEVAAESEDGVVEGIELPRNRFVIGVQFHPEETVETSPRTAELFHQFVEAALAYRRSRSSRSVDGQRRRERNPSTDADNGLAEGSWRPVVDAETAVGLRATDQPVEEGCGCHN